MASEAQQLIDRQRAAVWAGRPAPSSGWPVYVTEIQDVVGALCARGTAAEVAAWLADRRCPPARTVAVYRVEGEDWTLVDRRTTRAQGTAPAGYQGGVQRDAAWDAALAELG